MQGRKLRRRRLLLSSTIAFIRSTKGKDGGDLNADVALFPFPLSTIFSFVELLLKKVVGIIMTSSSFIVVACCVWMGGKEDLIVERGSSGVC